MNTPWTNHDVIAAAWTALHDALEAAVKRADEAALARGYGAELEADTKVAVADAFLKVEPLRDGLKKVIDALLLRACNLIGAPTSDLKAARDTIKAREQERRRAARQKVDDERARDGRIW